MMIVIVFASIAILLVSLARDGWPTSRIAATIAMVSINALLVGTFVHWANKLYGLESMLAQTVSLIVALELALLGARACGVAARNIAGYGLPTAAFGIFFLAVQNGESLLPLRLSLVLFLLAMAVPFAILTGSLDLIAKRQILRLALWFATTVSFLSLAWRVVRLWLVGPMKLVNSADALAYVPSEAFLFVPILCFTAFLFVGAVFCCLQWFWPRLITFSFVAFTFSLMAMVEFINLLFGWLPEVLQFLYLLAMTFGLEQWVRRSSKLISRTQLAFAAPLTIAATLVFLGFGSPHVEEIPNVGRPGNRQNVLLIVMDTARRKSIGAYGYDRATTPCLDHYAAMGTIFTNAITNSSWTLPSHASLFTGRWCHEHNASFLTPLDRKYPTIAEALSDAGYETVGFVANQGNCGRHTGLARGFRRYQDSPSVWSLSRSSSLLCQLLFGISPFVSRTAEEISNEFLDWLDHRRDSGPYFAFLNYLDPHFPYRIPDEQFDNFTHMPKEKREQQRQSWAAGPPNSFSPRSPLELEFAVDTYDGAIRYMDAHIGRVLERLEATGELANTLVVITNDHGEHFGEHGLFQHGTSLYRPLIDAPLIVLSPRIPLAGRVDAVVGLQDLPATILAALELPNLQGFPGQSWTNAWSMKEAPTLPKDRPVLSQLGMSVNVAGQRNSDGVVYSIVDGDLHYIASYGGMEELFDWSNDPAEVTNLALTPEGQALLPSLRTRLKGMLEGGTADDGRSITGADRSWWVPPPETH